MSILTSNNVKDQYSTEMLLHMYEDMVRIRKFEMQATVCFSAGELAGNIHTCVGQEATAVGSCQALEKTDFITSTHRGHGHCIGKGAKTDKVMAELFGKVTGYCRGKGGSMHVADLGLGILGANGIVGAGLPIATGSALTSKIRESGEVTLAFFGDAGSNHGTFHESINMAAAWNLPVVYLCENNLYGVSVDINSVINTETIAERAQAYGIPGVTVDGNDVLAVYEAVKTAVQHARQGKGPSIVECQTYRIRGHYEGDPSSYRPKELTEEWKKKDPIEKFREHLLKLGVSEDDLSAIDTAMDKEIKEAYEFAKSSPYPDVSEVTLDVYASENERSVIR
ncbi:thiamine pyrophosphate-dependent dehydrogenase E1 component subunit alpha [Priestia megaterium]|uniref:thiamine pyrophosphate-dependent dehydrogenase E1 component subunit alpha n=1 Tax=Priestia megaterium TaxID=1404 RepID=UPI003242180E